VLKCLAKLNKTLADMAPQIELSPVARELGALAATLAAAEKDTAPPELVAQIRLDICVCVRCAGI